MHPTPFSPLIIILLLPLIKLPLVAAHGGHDQQQPLGGQEEEADWATRHMAEEHHISNLDPSAFFSLHDYDSSTVWTPDEIRRTYGLEDDSTAHIPSTRKDEIVREVVKMFDYDGDGAVSREEFMAGWREGRRLADYGSGVGHHGDDEVEYEIHHFERFHDENTKEEDLNHPEDIAHFAKHDRLEAEQEKLDAMAKMSIVENNIPAKFRRNP